MCVCVCRARACAWARVHLSSMQRATMSSAASLVPPHISPLSHKRHGFLKKATEHKMCSNFL